MTKNELGIIKALATVFFQEGFDRNCGKHGLEYWCVNEEDLEEHCRQCTICDNEYATYLLNTTTINGKWYIRLYNTTRNEYGDIDNIKTLLLIPVDTKRLCWDEITKCASLINNFVN